MGCSGPKISGNNKETAHESGLFLFGMECVFSLRISTPYPF
jgi:hypothetical protein